MRPVQSSGFGFTVSGSGFRCSGSGSLRLKVCCCVGNPSSNNYDFDADKLEAAILHTAKEVSKLVHRPKLNNEHRTLCAKTTPKSLNLKLALQGRQRTVRGMEHARPTCRVALWTWGFRFSVKVPGTKRSARTNEVVGPHPHTHTQTNKRTLHCTIR